MAKSDWGLCKDCKWWQLEPKAKPEGLTGWRAAVRMLDLAAPAAAVGYGVGRIGCLTSGDGDYGINTTLPWGVHMAKNALVPPTPPDALVQPTPVYEFLFSLALAWVLWRLGSKAAACRSGTSWPRCRLRPGAMRR